MSIIRRRIFQVAAGAVLFAIAGVGHAQYTRSSISPEERALRRQNSKYLFKLADDALVTDPDHMDAHALRGTAYTMLGWPTEAVGEFDLVTGGDFYDLFAVHYHSLALMDIGANREAAQLQEGWRINDSPNPFTYISIEIHIVDALRQGQLWDEGLDAADFALATDPGNILIHSNVAHFYYDMGDVDEAMFQLFLGSRHTERNHRYQEVLAQMAYDEGLLDEAYERTVAARRQRARFPRLRALQMKVRCDGGEWEEVLKEANYPRFKDHAHPDLLEAESRCWALSGDLGQAKVLADDLAVLYPGFRQTNAARAFIEDLERRQK